MNVPNFLKLDGKSLLYNMDDESEFIFFIPTVFFDNSSKTPIAEIEGEYVTTLGLCNWGIIDKHGNIKTIKLFRFPTMIRTKPYVIEKIKSYKISENTEPDDYMILKYRKGDEVISEVRVPQLMDNVELFYKLAVISSKIPQGVPYSEGWKLFLENMGLNGNSYGLSAQLFGVLWSELCRDPKNISNPYRLSEKCKSGDDFGYKPISIKMVPKYISPYTSLVSENWDESLSSAIILSQNQSNEDIPYTPLEKIIMR